MECVGVGGISVTCDTFVWEISANQTSSWELRGLRVCVFIWLHSGLMGAASASITCNHGLRWRRQGGGVLCSQCMTSIKFLLTSCSIHTTTLLSGEQRSELHTNKVHTDLCLRLPFSASGANWALGALPAALLLCFISLSLFFAILGSIMAAKRRRKSTRRHHRLERAQTAVHTDDLRRHKQEPN